MREIPFHPPSTHLEDGTLLALHDREPSAELTAVYRAHLSGCADCRARFTTIVRQATFVSETVAEICVPPQNFETWRVRLEMRTHARASDSRRRTALVGATLLAIAGAAAAATVPSSPMRQWFAGLSRPKTVIGVPAAAARVDTTSAPDGSAVSFAATGPILTVRLDSAPAAGVLVIARTTGSDVSARVMPPPGDPMTVLPGELRVRNTSASRTNYTLSLPSGIVRLRVIVGERILLDGAPRDLVKLSR